VSSPQAAPRSRRGSSPPPPPPPPPQRTPHETGAALARAGVTSGAGTAALTIPAAARIAHRTKLLPASARMRSLAAAGLIGTGSTLGAAQGYAGGQLGARIAPEANIRDQSIIGHAALYAAPFAIVPPAAVAAGTAGIVAGAGTGLMAEEMAGPRLERVPEPQVRTPKMSSVARRWCVSRLLGDQQ